jgi:hypothetical protein
VNGTVPSVYGIPWVLDYLLKDNPSLFHLHLRREEKNISQLFFGASRFEILVELKKSGEVDYKILPTAIKIYLGFIGWTIFDHPPDGNLAVLCTDVDIASRNRVILLVRPLSGILILKKILTRHWKT